jgi:hypothetical protein
MIERNCLLRASVLCPHWDPHRLAEGPPAWVLLAASAGHVHCLDAAWERADDGTRASAGIVAACHGHANVLRILRERGSKLERVESALVSHGRLCLLKRLIAGQPVGARVGGLSCMALVPEALECIEYLVRERGLTLDRKHLWELIEDGPRGGFARLLALDPEAYTRGDTCYSPSARAAFHGDLGALEAIVAHGLSLDRRATLSALQGNQRDCLALLHRHGIVPDVRDLVAAARFLHGETLDYAVREMGLTPCTRALNMAARHGNVRFIEYLGERALLDPSTLTADLIYEVACARQIGCVRCLRSLGCPWDARVCEAAARRGYMEMLEYAHREGCPWDRERCLEAARSQRTAMNFVVAHWSCEPPRCSLGTPPVGATPIPL